MKILKAKLLCKCKYGNVWDVVEMPEDDFKAFGEWYVEETKEDLTVKPVKKPLWQSPEVKEKEEKEVKEKETKEVKEKKTK